MHLPTINHGVGWELLETRDGALVCPGLGLSEGHTTWLSRPIIVPKAWSMPALFSALELGMRCGVQDGERDAGAVGPTSRTQGLLPPS